jgi:hypothetical protein
MPNWKKVVLSGSNAAFNSITASNLPDGDGSEQLVALGPGGSFVSIGQGSLSSVVDGDWKEFPSYLTSSKGVIITGSISASGEARFLEGGVIITEAGESSAEIFVDGHITASGAISASGQLFASLSLNDTTHLKTVVYNSSSGQFFFTSGSDEVTSPITVSVQDPGDIPNTFQSLDGNALGGLQFFAGPNITLSQSGQVNDGIVSTAIHISASSGGGTPGGSNHHVQFNNDGAFGGRKDFKFFDGTGLAPQGGAMRVGTQQMPLAPPTVENQTNNENNLYSGSHVLRGGSPLMTNASIPTFNTTVVFTGFGQRFSIATDDGPEFHQVGNIADMLTAPLNLDDYSTPTSGISAFDGMEGNTLGGANYLTHVYAVIKPTGTGLFAHAFTTIPGSPSITIDGNGITVIPSASAEFDITGSSTQGTGSLITPIASASGRITITEASDPANSTFDIIGRKNTNFKTGESGSESNYLMYENTTDTVGIGKGITEASIKSISTSRLALISGGLSIHGGAAVNTNGLTVTGSVDTDTLAIKNQGQLNYTPQFRNEQVGNFSRFYFLGALATKFKQFRDFPNNKIEVVDGPNISQDGVYYEFRGGTAGRPDDATGINFGVSEADFVTPIRTDGTRDGIRINSNPTIEFFNSVPTGSISGTLAPSSASAQIKFDTGSSAIKFFAGSRDEDLKEVLHISKSGNNPRIGIGTTDPKTVFDFKDVEDTTTGAELLIRSARSTQGALSGDEGGSINFVIDSGSFTDLKTTGSIAKIKTKVTDVFAGGVAGKLAFELSKTAGGSTIDAFEYGFNIGGQGLFAAVQTASLIIKDFSAGGKSVLQMRDFSDNIRFEVNDGDVEISGSLGVTGSAHFKSNVDIDGTLSLGEFTDVSASLAAAVAGGDNLGNHTAATTLDLDGNSIKDALHITASGNISASGTIVGSNLSGTNTGDQDLSSYIQASQTSSFLTEISSGIISSSAQFGSSDNVTFGTIEATSLNVTNITSSIVTSSIIQTEGSNIFGDTISDTQTFNGHITASGNISASGQIIAEAGPSINVTLASDSATNIDTFNTSSNNGAIYDYTLFSAPSGARAGQCMVIHHNGNTDFTDTSTPTLGSETSIPFFETAVNGANVEVKIASGSGYTFKTFVKKL